MPQKATAEAGVRRARRRSAAHAGRRGPRAPAPPVARDVLHADKIDKIVGFHDVTRLTTLRNSAMLDPSHTQTPKGTGCAAMMNTPPYKPILSYGT